MLPILLVLTIWTFLCFKKNHVQLELTFERIMSIATKLIKHYYQNLIANKFVKIFLK